MLSLESVLEVRSLLDEGKLSRRAIAKATGVSRGSVNAIANGERGLHGASPPEEFQEGPRSSVAQRCDRCGGMVFMPCVLCEARQHAIATGVRPRQAA